MQVKSFDEALDFLPSDAKTAKEHGLLWSVAQFFVALSEGVSAAREYERLTHGGVASDEAARRLSARSAATMANAIATSTSEREIARARLKVPEKAVWMAQVNAGYRMMATTPKSEIV